MDRHVAGQWLSMIYESIKNDVRSSLYLGADETPITCLDRDFGKGSRKGYLWVYVNREGDCVYEWHMGRSVKCAEGMLAGYRGLLQSDAYQVYETLSCKEGFLLVGCMAHARRKFMRPGATMTNGPADGISSRSENFTKSSASSRRTPAWTASPCARNAACPCWSKSRGDSTSMCRLWIRARKATRR